MDLDVKRWDVHSTKVRRYPHRLDWTCVVQVLRFYAYALDLLLELVVGVSGGGNCKNAI